MLRKFVEDRRGQFAMMTAIAIVPILGGMALAIDFTEMNRHHQETLNALDAAGIATARYISAGATDAEARIYAKDFFEANLHAVDPVNTDLTVLLPTENVGSGTLKLTAKLDYHPYFFPAFTSLVNGSAGSTVMDFAAVSEVKLKNTLEVALVLDNSGSMSEEGGTSGDERIDLLKAAAKQLIDTLSAEAGQMKQISKPVQFSLVPFASAVNVGSGNADKTWMDTTGISPIHHENFAWATMGAYDANKKVEPTAGVYYKRGTGWGTAKDTIVTRFTLYEEMVHKVKTGWQQVCADWDGDYCDDWNWEPVLDDVQYSWKGCVEARPSPYNVNDDPAVTGTPATMFVPMFAPDETDKRDGNGWAAHNNWLTDKTSSTSNSARQRYMPKYFDASVISAGADGMDEGPNTGCTTSPITPLVDVSTQAGVDTIKASIDAMYPLGATNVPEGLAWGWRSVSGGAPFTEGRPDTEKGNDKVVIVLTDGANTYYTPGSLGMKSYSNFNNGDDYTRANDLAGNKATYSAYGYTGAGNFSSTYTYPRIFQGTSTNITKTDYSNKNYSKAMDEQLAAVCTNAKDKGIVVMTIALDLDATKGTAEQQAMVAAQIAGLENCASKSRFRDAKLFWNTDGDDLDDTFDKIADELSNLRIVS